MTVSFSALLNDLENTPVPSPGKRKQQNISGALTTEGEQKIEPGGNTLTYLDLSETESGEGAKRDSNIFGADEEDSTSTDMAMAEAMFKVSTYFDTQGTSPFWKLTPIEQRHLRGLISMEEKRNNTSDCLGIVKIMLQSLESQEDRLGVVDFIAEEAKYALGAGDISFFQIFMEQLRREAQAIAAQGGAHENWTADFLNELNKKLGSSDVLDILGESLDEKVLTDTYLSELRNFLFLLPPETLYALVGIMPKIQNQRLERNILSVVAVESCYLKANIAPLISGLKSALILELVHIIKNSRLPVPTALMTGLTRNESHFVRKEAAQLLLDSNPDNLKHLFHLMDDSNLGINSMICSYMGRQRSPLAERVLLDHLDNSYNQQHANHSKAHVLNCYRALGLCASASAVIFLQDVLMRKNWKSFLGLEGNWHGIGAALALMLMPDEWGTRDILQKATQSHFRNIRHACEQAEQELPLGWKITDDD